MQKYRLTKICCYVGYFVQAIINNFLPLLFVIFNENYGLSYEKIGSLIVINFVTQICVDLCSIKIIKWLGYHKCAVLANFCAAAGLILLSVLPNIIGNTFLAIVLSILVYATGSGLIEVIISPIIEYLPTEKSKKAAEMCLLHSFYCWGHLLTVIITLLLFFVFGQGDWQYVALIWAAVPLINAFIFIKAPIVDPELEEREKGTKKEKPTINIFKSVYFYIFILLMICSGACELSVSQWASAFAEQGMGLTKAMGDLAGPCAFALLMGISRMLYGILGERLRMKTAMAVCAALCLVCYIVLAVSPIPVLSLVFCAVCGFSVGIMWPGVLSMAAGKFKSAGATVFGLLAAAGDIGAASGPFVVGLFADELGLRAGFSVAAAFPLLMLSLCIFMIFKDRH